MGRRISYWGGNHFFFYMKRLFWFKLNRLESSGTNLEKREIVIKTLGRNQTILDSLVSNFKYKNDNDELMSILYLHLKDGIE